MRLNLRILFFKPLNLRIILPQMKKKLDALVAKYNHSDFLDSDPLGVAHRFAKQQDQEIAGFFAAIFAWGQRKTIIAKASDFMQRMDNAPHDFITNHTPQDLHQILGFKHRTFNEQDALYCIKTLQKIYTKHQSLEAAFLNPDFAKNENTYQNLVHFYQVFFADNEPNRTRKHIATPQTGSACKRLSMLLRWFVRHDAQGVDLGIWRNIKPHQLIMPLDVHVLRQAELLGLLPNQKASWQAAVQLTNLLKEFDESDPVKYDFALFGLGVG